MHTGTVACHLHWPFRSARRAVLAALLLLGGFLSGCGQANDSKPVADGSAVEPEEKPRPRPAVKPKPRPKPLIELTAAEEKQVREITDKGVAFLRKEQNKDGSWTWKDRKHPVGVTALAGLTLLECGAPAKDPAVQNTARSLRDAADKLTWTYDLALSVLFFNRLGEPEDRPRVRKLALRLAAGQTLAGGWGYQCHVLSDDVQQQIEATLRELQNTSPGRRPEVRAKLRDALPKPLRKLAVLQDIDGRNADFFRGGGDNSNTQFALLAVWAAQRHDLPLTPSLELVAKRFTRSQDANGQWHYAGLQNVRRNPAMTCAGLLGMAVHYGLRDPERKPRAPANDPAIQKALKVLGDNIARSRQNKVKNHEMYYLWSVERVAVLFQLKEIAGERWYHWGMDLLVKQQKEDGGWPVSADYSNRVADTCLALLFLQRVNLAADLTDKLRELEALLARAGEPARKE
jgi:hypothetical protein